MQLSDLGEFGFIDEMRSWLRPAEALVGVGDDAAITEFGKSRLVATTDALVEDVHFRFDWSSTSDVGAKAVSVNVSDIAAMGATPRWLLVVVCAPVSTDVETLRGIYAGIQEACATYEVELIGGDTVRAPQVVLSVTALGELDGDPLLRSGARVGDVLAVTGPLGRAAAGVNLLLSNDPRAVVPEDAIACIDAHRRPVARVKEGLRLKEEGAHAAIDVTDGLAPDARRLADASGVGIEIDVASLPIAREALAVAAARGWDANQMVLGGGEDLELLVAVGPEVDLEELGLLRCGRVVDSGMWLVHDGVRSELDAAGYDHFSKAP